VSAYLPCLCGRVRPQFPPVGPVFLYICPLTYLKTHVQTSQIFHAFCLWLWLGITLTTVQLHYVVAAVYGGITFLYNGQAFKGHTKMVYTQSDAPVVSTGENCDVYVYLVKHCINAFDLYDSWCDVNFRMHIDIQESVDHVLQ